MSYHIYEVPSDSGRYVDIVYADAENPNTPAYTHYAFTIGTTANRNELIQRRGILFQSLRDWNGVFQKFPELKHKLSNSVPYYPGESVLGQSSVSPDFMKRTVMRLGALELLANIFSGRITANDKDPFPHQLALQQYMKTHEGQVQRLLVADEVGLGKTIEIGLVLRDILIARGQIDKFRCLYLTKGGLLTDAQAKLRSVIQGAIGNDPLVQVESTFRDYGRNPTFGVHIASVDAARRYVRPRQKKLLPSNVSPDVIVIDECHHCGSTGDLSHPKKIEQTDTTRTYEAVYQMIKGTFWPESDAPGLVIFMSATPFRSRIQFVNLLRLLTHDTRSLKDAYTSQIKDAELVQEIEKEEASAVVVWRQQDDVKNWSDQRLFPNLTIKRPPLVTSPEYLQVIEQIRHAVQEIAANNDQHFGGFAIAQLEKRLTSSSIAGACWIFRWCVRHLKWGTQREFENDRSLGTENLRKLIRLISQRLATYDVRNTRGHVDVDFPSDNFMFGAQVIAQRGWLKDIYDFSEKLRKQDSDEDEDFVADPDEIVQLTELGIKLLSFADIPDGEGVENSKLNWLQQMLRDYPDSRFLVFTESLQTCDIITKSLPRESEKLTGNLDGSSRERAVARFRDPNSSVRVLVATSAADEGFDFQVANRVVHWDLSPSPAVLMQRNGRVARLGQVADVTAYYLIIRGTHEERRDKALQERFNRLGIHDERLRLKILGSLTSDEEEQIDQLVSEADGQQLPLIDSILQNAKREQEEMNEHLRNLQHDIQAQSVIDREMLAVRLERWLALGMPDDSTHFGLKLSTQQWDRPIFSEKSTTEKAAAKVAVIKQRNITFDPAFRLFAKSGDKYTLAGLRPWISRENRGVIGHEPLPNSDPIGELARLFARQSQADFATLASERFCQAFPEFIGARHILFATHPLRETEKMQEEIALSYLTFYTFGADRNIPLNSQGAKADDVHKLISLLEDEAQLSGLITLEPGLTEEMQKVGRALAGWLRDKTTLGGLVSESVFLPIPVALVALR